MDDLDIFGRLGGAVSLTSGYARNPLVITRPDGQKLAVVSEETFVDFGAAITHDRFRAYIDFPVPLVLSGTLGEYFTDGAVNCPTVQTGANSSTASAGAQVRRIQRLGSCRRA